MERKHVILLIVAALIVIGLWVATPYAVRWRFPGDATRQGTFGDLYGSINSLFSGLALLGVIAAIMLQQKELSLSTKELKNSATALRKQVELSADAARLQVLPELIRAQKARIRTITGEDISETDFNEEALRHKIKDIEGYIATHPARLASIQKKLATAHEIHKHTVQADARRLIELVVNQGRSKPEWELLLQYQTDLGQIYQKISTTRLDTEFVA